MCKKNNLNGSGEPYISAAERNLAEANWYTFFSKSLTVLKTAGKVVTGYSCVDSTSNIIMAPEGQKT